MTDYNQKYYDLAVLSLQDMKYYYGDIIHDCVEHIKRYFPGAEDREISHAVQWALADTWNGGCEVEVV